MTSSPNTSVVSQIVKELNKAIKDDQCTAAIRLARALAGVLDARRQAEIALGATKE